MIPKEITRYHILKAIKEVDAKGIPKGRNSKKFALEFNGNHYPPKYIISLANKYANGRELPSEDFNGGPESNDFLKNLQFKIRLYPPNKKGPKQTTQKKKNSSLVKLRHNERCPECKIRIKELLEKIYGDVIENFSFNVGLRPEEFKKSKYIETLKSIFKTLQKRRSFTDFVKTKKLKPCDLYIPFPGFLVEMDESQHFSSSRAATLLRYPKNLTVAFNKNRWISLCREIDAKDNDPPYREEQRAWYDTLRDFLPAFNGLHPTVRLFLKDLKWCELNPRNPRNIEIFKEQLSLYPPMEKGIPSVARIILTKEWEGNPKRAGKILEKLCKKWPQKLKVDYIQTCGGFIQFDWPKWIRREDVGDNKDPNKRAFNALIKEAEKYIQVVLNKEQGKKLKKMTHYITFGIDSFKDKISTTKNRISDLHIELVCLVDLKSEKFHWTGKFYPTNGQESGLVRINDPKKHFFNLENIGNTLILGCHDLTLFNDRNKNKTGKWRAKLKQEFRILTKREKPVLVLHHPHTTVTKRTWCHGWAWLRKNLDSVKQYSGAGRYFEDENDRDKARWDNLDSVLKSTRKVNTIDFIL